jgi:hypothetical protein
MPIVIVTAQVQDPVKWEAGFRTHGDLFRKNYTLRSPVHYTITGNEVAIYMEPENLKSFKQALESQATAEAMAFDGVKRETVKTFVLDKEMKL